jgi:class 3 adenylate cyclase
MMPQEHAPRPTAADAVAQTVQLRAFLIADVRGYTRFTSEQGNEAATALAAQFASVVRSTVAVHGGELLELRGDEAMCVFPLALEALRASIEVQWRLRSETDDGPPLPLGVGIGVDVGEAVPIEGGYRGAALNVASRLCALAGSGQILASDTAARLAGGLAGARYASRRPVRLKGIAEPVRIVEVVPETPFPALPQPPRRRRRWGIAAAVALAALGTAALGVALSTHRNNQHSSRPPAAPVNAGIYRIDARTGHITDTIPLGANALRTPGNRVPRASPSLLYAFGSIWATYGTPGSQAEGGIARIDLQTHKVVKFPIHGAGSLAACGTKLCATGGDIGTNNLMFIDPHDPLGSDIPVLTTQPYHRNSTEPLPGSDAPGLQAGFYIAEGFGSVWIRETGSAGCCDGRVFWRIDLGTHRVVGRWLNPDSFSVGREGVWLVRGEKLYRIDPQTNEEILVRGVGRAWLVAAGNGAVWVSDFPVRGTELHELNPQTGLVVWSHFIPKISAARLIAGDGHVWLEDVFGGTLTRLDAYDHKLAPPIRFGAANGAGGIAPGTMTLSPGAVWVRFPGPQGGLLRGDSRP